MMVRRGRRLAGAVAADDARWSCPAASVADDVAQHRHAGDVDADVVEDAASAASSRSPRAAPRGRCSTCSGGPVGGDACPAIQTATRVGVAGRRCPCRARRTPLVTLALVAAPVTSGHRWPCFSSEATPLVGSSMINSFGWSGERHRRRRAACACPSAAHGRRDRRRASAHADEFERVIDLLAVDAAPASGLRAAMRPACADRRQLEALPAPCARGRAAGAETSGRCRDARSRAASWLRDVLASERRPCRCLGSQKAGARC